MRRRILILLPLLLFGLLAWGAVPSYGDRKWIQDPQDSAGGLDIKSVSQGHGRWKGLVRHTLTTYESWDTSLLHERREEGNTYATVYLILESPSFRQSHGVIKVKVNQDGGLYARLSMRGFRGYGRAWRSDQRSITVEFNKRAFAKRMKRYTWYGATGFADPTIKRCSGKESGIGRSAKVCYDFSPQVRHDVSIEPRLRTTTISFLNDEYIVVQNRGKGEWDIEGWTVADAGGDNRYSFPDLTLNSGDRVFLHTEEGEEEPAVSVCNGHCVTTHHLYWDLDHEVWNDNGDTARLRNSRRALVDHCRYRRDATNPFRCFLR